MLDALSCATHRSPTAQLVDVNDGKGQTTVVPIPVLVVVAGDIAPPEQLGVNSVMMKKENVIEMKEMGMGWIPFANELGIS